MIRHPRRIALVIGAASLLIAGVWAAVDYRVRLRLTAGPMVQALTADGFALVWRIHPAEASMTVRVKRDDDLEIGTFPVEAENEELGQYVAVVSGLDPATRYRYRITSASSGDEEPPLAEGDVRTAPLSGGAFRFLAFGDGGTGCRATRQLARRMLDYQPDLIIHTGDIISPRGLPENLPAKFYRPYADLIARAPLYPCMGNHEFRTDRGQPVLDAFVLPANGPAGQDKEHFYWFDVADARFVSIDSNYDYPLYRDVIAPWLSEVLAGAGGRWKIVFFHEPVFTNGRHEPADKLLDSIVPVIDEHEVDLVLAGHNHLYERTHPIRNGEVTPAGQGTVYITSGSGGNNLYEARQPPPPFMAAWCDDQHSFTVVDVTPTVLTLRQVVSDGRVVDEHHLTRGFGQ